MKSGRVLLAFLGLFALQHAFAQVNPEKLPQNSSSIIGGREYTGHALDSMQSRGIMPSAVEDAIQTGTKRLEGNAITYLSTHNKLRVVTDAQTGRVITVTWSEGFSARPGHFQSIE